MKFVNRCFQILVLAGSIQAAALFSLVTDIPTPKNILEWALIIFACGIPAMLGACDSATRSMIERKGVRVTSVGGSLGFFLLAFALNLPLAAAFLLCSLLWSSVVVVFSAPLKQESSSDEFVG
jgi:hypothetical protein